VSAPAPPLPRGRSLHAIVARPITYQIAVAIWLHIRHRFRGMKKPRRSGASQVMLTEDPGPGEVVGPGSVRGRCPRERSGLAEQSTSRFHAAKMKKPRNRAGRVVVR
jgi:hypothetical protein